MTRWFLALGLIGGCSLAMNGPDSVAPRARAKAPDCTRSKGLVLTDGILAGVAGVVALSVANQGSVALAPALAAALFAGSAIHGNNIADACRKERGEYFAVYPERVGDDDDDRDDLRALRGPGKLQPAVAATTPHGAPPPVDDDEEPVAVKPVTKAPVAPVREPTDAEAPAAARTAPAAKAPVQPAPPPADAWGEFWKEIR